MAQENQPDAIKIVRGRGRWAGWVRFDDHGITFRTRPGPSRTSLIGWDEVLWFRDGTYGNGWALAIELHDGRVVTAEATSSGKPTARPETLTAVRHAAERYAVPAVLTGTPASSGPPIGPGLYTDPGGKLGLRQWSGTEWSPFLQVDPASSGPGGGKGPAQVWSPLPQAVQQVQWIDAASRARRERIILTRLLVAVAGAVTVTVAVWAYYLSKPHPNFWAAWTATAVAGFCLLFALGSGLQYKNRRKIDQAGKAAAKLAGAVDSTEGPVDDQGECPVTGTPVDDRASVAVAPAAAAEPRARCLECGAERANATDVCARCGAP